MSHQFKAGDPALTLVSNYQMPAMSAVSLVVFIPDVQGAIEPDGAVWFAPHEGWIVERDGEDGYGFFKPAHLMPLRGNFAPEQQKSREVVA
jgi:hypothetical protein